MTLRGKDYCNCEHAHMLREAIESALTCLQKGSTGGGYGATLTLENALKTDAAACLDLWGDLQTAKECERIIK